MGIWNLWPFKIRKHLKSRLFENQISNGLVFKRSGLSYGPNHLKSEHFCPDFKWLLAKWWPFVRISDGWAGLLNFRSHSKSEPFANQPLFDHSKSGLVWISECNDSLMIRETSEIKPLVTKCNIFNLFCLAWCIGNGIQIETGSE